MTYFQEIEEIIKTHPEINQAVIQDVLQRARDWMKHEYATEDDNYIKRNRDYLLRWIK